MAEPVRTGGSRTFAGRVLYVAGASATGDADRALLVMLRHLDRDRIEPAVVLGARTPLAEAIEQMDIPVTVTSLPMRSGGSIFGWWRSVAQVVAVVHRFRPHILHANDVASCQALSVVGAQSRIPRVLHIRWGITAHAAGWWARRGVEGILCTSQWVRRQLGDLAGTALGSAWTTVLPDAVDWPAVKPQATPPATSPAGGVTDRPHVGFVGQLTPDQGLDTIVDALAIMRSEDRPILLIAGEADPPALEYRDQLERLARRRGVADCIKWHGPLVAEARFYQQIRAVVCPWQAGPAGVTSLEASCFGVPAFASRDGSFPEIIEHNVTGVLVKPTAEGWAKALKQVQIHAWTGELGQRARERTCRDHAPELQQRRLVAAYQRVIGPSV